MKLSGHRVLFWVDGVSHLVLGPVALFLLTPFADLIGVPPTPLFWFLALFTLYGALVVWMGCDDRAVRRLGSLARSANVLFVASILLSSVVHGLTPAGFAIHLLAVASAVVILGVLAVAPDTNDRR